LAQSFTDFANKLSKPDFSIIGITDLAASFSNVFSGALTALQSIGSLIGSIFGSGKNAQEQAEQQRLNAEALEKSREAAQKAAQALENLRDAAERFSAGRFVEELDKIDDELNTLAGGTRRLTAAEIERAAALTAEALIEQANIDAINARIREIEERGGIVPQELWDQLAEAQARLDPLIIALSDLGLSISSLTPLELEKWQHARWSFEDGCFSSVQDNLRGISLSD
jgi:ABC-type hemin transport system substrate-binding protein